MANTEKTQTSPVKRKPLKIFSNMKSTKNSVAHRSASFQELKRLESSVLIEVGKVLTGKVKVACFEVNNADLGAMLEVLSLPSIQTRYIVRQQEIPNEFVFQQRDLGLF